MKLLTQPQTFIEEVFGARVTLVYGDVQGTNEIVLYSTDPLEGYEKVGEVFEKRIPLSAPILESEGGRLADRRGFPYPRENVFWEREDDNPNTPFVKKVTIQDGPSEGEKKLLGVRGSYAYVDSKNLRYMLDDKGYGYWKREAEFLLDCPDDISLAHESAHVAAYRHRWKVFPKLMCLTDRKWTRNARFLFGYLDGTIEELDSTRVELDREEIANETLAFFGELGYIVRFHPEIEGDYHDWRSKGPNDIYNEAYRLLREHYNELEGAISIIKGLNLVGD